MVYNVADYYLDIIYEHLCWSILLLRALLMIVFWITGRELEQAAAHTLAIKGGVAQDTPETIMSHEPPPPDKASLAPEVPQLEEIDHHQPNGVHHTDCQPNGHSAHGSEAELDSRLQVGEEPLRKGGNEIKQQGEASLEIGEAKALEGNDHRKVVDNNGSVAVRQSAQRRKTAQAAEERPGSVRASKRTKHPAPWR